ncbi:hypothetical protein RHS03_08756, partial [Rhizoctonia solani]
MGFSELPVELIYLILQFTSNGFTTLLNLYVIDRQTYRFLRALVYQSVRVTSARSLGSFYDVVTSLRPRYSTYVTTIQIGPECCIDSDDSLQLSKGLITQLRCVLGSLDNLKSLSLMVPRNALNEILDGLTVPFSLNAFVHSGEYSASLYRFLQTQSSITKLGWHRSTTESDADSLRNSLQSNPDLLPNLDQLEGSAPIVTSLLSLRPISTVTVL